MQKLRTFLHQEREEEEVLPDRRLETNAVNGAKKNGETNQQWRWSRCKKGATHLVNVATGGCLTLEGSVSDECDTVWEHGDNGVVSGTGTLFGKVMTDDNASGFA